MPNSDLDATWKYHNGTKHSYLSLRAHPHFLDWENQPLLFKIYPTLQVARLPKDVRPTGVAALSAIATTTVPSRKKLPTLDEIAQLLFFSAGVTKSKKFPGGEMFFRAAACTGALYEVELYLVCQDLPDLPAGVYHFGAAEFGLRQLRAGDYRQVLVEATGNEPDLAQAPLVIVHTGTFWRNAWKYRSRTYRHFGWDNGTILANMLAMCASLGWHATVDAGFVDARVNSLLGLDTSKEVTLSLTVVGSGGSKPPKEPGETPLELPVLPYSKEEVEYPAMRQMHEASSLATADEVKNWRMSRWVTPMPAPKGKLVKLDPLDAPVLDDTIEQVIQRRGSSRRFAREGIAFDQLSTILDYATRGIPADFLEPIGAHLNEMYLIVNHVHGLVAGAYYFHRASKQLELLTEGDFREPAGHLGLDQELPADASVDVFFLADLHKITAAYGNRGYRAVQLEAGILGGKLYLAAYAQKMGASGLTFYDDDVVNFFAPHSKGKSAIFLVALGHGVRPKPVR